MKLTDDTKSRRWGLILWCDNKKNMNSLEYIKRFYDNYIYILHDHDINDTGSPKKPHYHVLLVFDNQKKLSTLENQTQIERNNVYYINTLDGQLRYLIHLDDEDKYQYSKDEVHGSLYMMSKFRKAIQSQKDEEEQVTSIVEFIECCNPHSLSEVLHFVLDNNLYSTYRRNYLMFKDLFHSNYGKVVRK